jgi:hypothetical protein
LLAALWRDNHALNTAQFDRERWKEIQDYGRMKIIKITINLSPKRRFHRAIDAFLYLSVYDVIVLFARLKRHFTKKLLLRFA